MTVEPATLEERVLAATHRCVSRWGVAKTTFDDVAREAGVSRASAYRAFPGGKDSLVKTMVRAEVAELLSAIEKRVVAADSLEDALGEAVVESGQRISADSALRFVLRYEPEVVLPRVSFDGLSELLSCVSRWAQPLLERWLPPEEARRTAEWVTRIVISYSICPDNIVDLADEKSARRLVRTHILPVAKSLVAPLARTRPLVTA